jgi:hypothetical protein
MLGRRGSSRDGSGAQFRLQKTPHFSHYATFFLRPAHFFLFSAEPNLVAHPDEEHPYARRVYTRVTLLRMEDVNTIDQRWSAELYYEYVSVRAPSQARRAPSPRPGPKQVRVCS